MREKSRNTVVVASFAQYSAAIIVTKNLPLQNLEKKLKLKEAIQAVCQ